MKKEINEDGDRDTERESEITDDGDRGEGRDWCLIKRKVDR